MPGAWRYSPPAASAPDHRASRGLAVLERPLRIENSQCDTCNNHCRITAVELQGESGQERWGYGCGKDPDAPRPRRLDTYAAFELQRRLLRSPPAPKPPLDAPKVVVPAGLSTHSYWPFWNAFLFSLGLRPQLTGRLDERVRRLANAACGADYCFPAKVALGQALAAAQDEADWMLVPAMICEQQQVPTTNPDEAGAVKIDSRLLEELKERLTAEQDCHPGCAELSRMMIDAAGASLTLRLAVGAVIDTAIPIPGRRDQWQPRQAMLDGKPAVLVRDTQGVSWLLVPKGAHQIVLEGPLADSQQLSLPMKPRLVTVHASGHRVEGIDAEGVPADALRIATLTAHAGVKDLAQGQIPSFVRIERSFTLGLHWEIVTRVVRVSADTSPVSIDLPLLPGETVVSENVRAAKGHVQAVLPAQAEAMEWRSTLAERSEFALTSGKQTGWVEVWRFDTGALWHAEFEGLAPVHHQSEGRWMPEWRPWPGETLKAKITRPEGVAGRALTIDDSTLELSPGLRSTDTKLALTLRSSRGGEHTITLPEGAQLLGASINGASQPLRLEARSLRLPVVPGAQLVELSWREPRGMDVLLHTPEVKLNAPSVNATVQVHLPLERWVLWVSGPRAGPAILFWGVLLALIPISFALARVRLAPLAARDWFLLGLGLTQSPVGASIVIVAWFFALALREKRADVLSNRVHNLLQVALAVLTVTALALLVSAVSNSLLGTPEMQIIGNGSSSMLLNWYQDRSSDALPVAQVLSVPLLVYRLAMLAWALWLAMKLIGWLKWGWRCFAAGGYWRRTVLDKAA